MSRVVERVDAWCRSGDFTVEDLARYRILYGLLSLLWLRDFSGVANRPKGQFDPPPGPFMLFDSVPPRSLLEALEIAVAVLVVFLLMGFKTRATSLLLAAAMLFHSGFVFSFGKIDHGIFVILVPAVMAFSGWGGAMSVDAHAAARRGKPIEASQWAMRLLAFMIGLSFLTAGMAKVAAGWLDLHTHASRGYFLQRYVSGYNDDDFLAPTLLRLHDVGILWEALDWFTVAMECGLVVTVLWWRTFRIGVAAAALFHLGVLLMLNIQFSANLVAYAAFIRWNLFAPTKAGSTIPLSQPVACLLGLGLGYGAYSIHQSDLERFIPAIRQELLFVGGAVAVVFLACQALLGIKQVSEWRARRYSKPQPSDP